MDQPSRVEYATTPEGFVAYRSAGSAPPDILLISDWFSHVGLMWEHNSPFRPVLDRLSSFGRVITFDKRGVGLSDPVALLGLPTLEDWIDDVRAVLDAIGVERATIVGKGSGGPLALLFAASHPQRVSALVLINAWARLGQAEDFPLGVPAEYQAEMLATPYMPNDSVRVLAGEPLSAQVESWWQDYVRFAVSPTTSLTMRRWLFSVDVRAALPAVRCPVLAMAREGAWIGPHHATYITERLPEACFVPLPGSADFLFSGDTESMLDEIETFVTGRAPQPPVNRVLATVLYTDLVGSTAFANRLGDHRWAQLLDRHDDIVRAELREASGREIKTTGDGFVSTFDGPARAIRCAVGVRDQLRDLGLEIRAGLHAGEIELRGDEVGGIAMHVGSRVQSLAEPGEILVSRTVRDLVAGSGITFESKGLHTLRGVQEDWELYAVAQ